MCARCKRVPSNGMNWRCCQTIRNTENPNEQKIKIEVNGKLKQKEHVSRVRTEPKTNDTCCRMTESNLNTENRANGQELEKLYQSAIITAIFTHCELRNAQTLAATNDTFTSPFRYLIAEMNDALFRFVYKNYHITCTIIHPVWAHWWDKHV